MFTEKRKSYLKTINNSMEDYVKIGTYKLINTHRQIKDSTCVYAFPAVNWQIYNKYKNNIFIKDLKANDDSLINRITVYTSHYGLKLFDTSNITEMKQILKTELLPIPFLLEIPVPLINFEVVITFINDDIVDTKSLELFCDYYTSTKPAIENLRDMVVYGDIEHNIKCLTFDEHIYTTEYNINTEWFNKSDNIYLICEELQSCDCKTKKISSNIYEILDRPNVINIKNKQNNSVIIVICDDNCLRFANGLCGYRYLF